MTSVCHQKMSISSKSKDSTIAVLLELFKLVNENWNPEMILAHYRRRDA